MQSFKKTIYFNRGKEENWDIVKKATKLKYENPDKFLYLGYEIELKVEIFDDGVVKVLKISGVDVSDRNINI